MTQPNPTQEQSTLLVKNHAKPTTTDLVDHPQTINPTQEQIEAATQLFSDQEFVDAICGHEQGWSDIVSKKINAATAQREASARQQGIEEAASNYNQSDCLYECEVDDLRFVCTVPPEGAKVIKKYVRALSKEQDENEEINQ